MAGVAGKKRPGPTGTAENRPERPPTSKAMYLAIFGALVTGTTGVSMAIFSVLLGEETGGAALLAASALAFGLLALSLNRTVGRTMDTVSLAEAIALDRQARDNTASHQHGQGGYDGKGVLLQAFSAVGGAVATRTPYATATAIEAEPITDRERQVLALVAEGNSNKLISASLGISERTVKNHLTASMTKLRASDRTHAVVTAIRLGWLDI